MSTAELPVPSDEALLQSAALVAKIRGEIAAAGGWIDFARYMELALYAPGLGYYSAGSTKIGPAGDFVTAPELSRSFGSAVARRGLWREAAFRFEKAVEKEPSNARAHNNLAVALEASGEFARALAEYKKALELDPNDSYIRRNYARFAEFYTSYTRTTGKATGGT